MLTHFLRFGLKKFTFTQSLKKIIRNTWLLLPVKIRRYILDEIVFIFSYSLNAKRTLLKGNIVVAGFIGTNSGLGELARQMINQFSGSKDRPPQFTRGYGLVFGHQERKAMAMSLVDRSLRAKELGETIESPAQMEEFVLSHSDSLESSGFVQHLKLPHYVDFQSELELVRRLRKSALEESAHG